MLLLVLSLVLLVTFGLIVVRPQYTGRLTSFATLVAAILLMLWMQDQGLLPGTTGPMSGSRPATRLDTP
jgi:hypothetical protein